MSFDPELFGQAVGAAIRKQMEPLQQEIAALKAHIESMPIPEDGKNGRDGKDGRDGLGLEDLQLEFDGDRTITLSLVRDDVRKEASVTLPVMIYRGVFNLEGVYTKGDCVTWAGSVWVSEQDAPTGKPGEPGSDGWRLAVKRGRDGKDGRNGRDVTASVKLGDS